MSSGMLMVGPGNAGLAAELRAMRASLRTAVELRIRRDVDEGLLSAEVDPGAVARFYVAVLQGLSTAALDGASPEELAAVAAFALKAWPGSVGPRQRVVEP